MRRAYPAHRDSGVEWLGDVPAHWDVTVVKRNYQVTLGKMLQGDPIDHDDVETPYLKALHVQWAGLQVDDAPTMWANPGEIEHFSLTSGDLLVCEGGEGGRSCLLPAGFERYIIQNSLHRVRPRGDNSNAYLCYVLSCISDRGWFAVLSDRATIAHFTREKFASLVIPVPPADEQRAIAAFLDHETVRIDGLIEKNRLLIERLAEYRTALITRAVTAGLDPSSHLKPSGVEWLGEIPEHWEVSSAKHQYDIKLGKMLQSEPTEDLDVETPYLKALHVQWDGLRISDSTTMWASPGDAQHFSVVQGDLLVCEGGEGGRCCFVPPGIEDHIIQNSLHRVRPREANSIRYLRYLLYGISKSDWLTALSDKATIAHFTREKFASLAIPLPSCEEQHAIAEYLDRETDRIDALTSKAEAAIERLQEYRAALITAAVTGKIDVREPEQAP